jgi:hypothetical protein
MSAQVRELYADVGMQRIAAAGMMEARAGSCDPQLSAHARRTYRRSMDMNVSRTMLLAVLAACTASCVSSGSKSSELERASVDAGQVELAIAASRSSEGREASVADDVHETSSVHDTNAAAVFGPRIVETTLETSSELAPFIAAPSAPSQFVVHVIDYDRLIARTGFYFTAGVTGSQGLGDLDGESVLLGPSTVLLPSMDAGVGFNVGFGMRTFADAFELTYDQGFHSGSFQGAKLDSIDHVVNFDWKHFFLIDRRVQPYTLLGFNIPWLDIEDGAHKGAKVGDATLYGFGMNLGGGAAYYLTPQMSIYFQAVMRLIDYYDVSALGHSGSINGDIFSEGWKLTLGTAFTF